MPVAGGGAGPVSPTGPPGVKPGGLRAMTEFQLLVLRRLDGVPRLVGAFGSGRGACVGSCAGWARVLGDGARSEPGYRRLPPQCATGSKWPPQTLAEQSVKGPGASGGRWGCRAKNRLVCAWLPNSREIPSHKDAAIPLLAPRATIRSWAAFRCPLTSTGTRAWLSRATASTSTCAARHQSLEGEFVSSSPWSECRPGGRPGSVANSDGLVSRWCNGTFVAKIWLAF